MNSCVLMAKIVSKPELRYVADSETPVAQMLVEFDSLANDNTVSTLKVVGWGQLAQRISDNFAEGDRVLLEGRLSMNVFERKEGFREKRAELVASRIHHLSITPDSETDTHTPTNLEQVPSPAAPTATTTTSNSPAEEQIDEIPF